MSSTTSPWCVCSSRATGHTPTLTGSTRPCAFWAGHATGDIGLMQPLISVMGVGFLGGSLLFGIALFRANVLARWAGALLAVAAVATAVSPQLPINQRLFAIPTGVALVGLGYSLWRGQRSPATVSQPSTLSSQLDTAGA